MIVIDPSKGGKDEGNVGNGIKEKDYTLLISEYIYDRLKQLGADVKIIRQTDEYISDSDRVEKIKNAYGDNPKVVALSNRIGSRSESGAEIIYALRNNNTLAENIAEQLAESGLSVNKWYQRRNSSDTSKDDDTIIRDTGTIETIIVDYGNIRNENDVNKLKNKYEKYAEAVVKAVANYTGVKYKSESGLEEIYTVKKGDSLYSISKKYNTTVEELKKYNNLTSNLLNIGDVLKIPSKTNEEEIIKEDTYIVKKGDSLYSIAQKYNTTVDKIKQENNLTSNLLSIGQELKIPGTTSSNIYIVKKGDSLYSIAQKYNTTVDKIKQENNLTSNLLSIGQELKIPGTISSNIYIVKKGDSLYSIAQKYNTTVDKIKQENNLTSNLLNIGQKLKIPT